MSDISEYPFGTVVTVFGEFDVASVPTDPATVRLYVQQPDGTEVIYTYPAAPIVKTSVGRYEADLEPGMGGVWRYRWEGDGLADGAREGSFYIAPSFVGTDVYTYDPSTPIGEIRLYTDDRDLSATTAANPRRRSAIFTDAELNIFLTKTGNTLSAAALALRTIAINRALLVQRREIGKTNVDYGDLRADLMKAADALLVQAVELGVTVNAPADGFVEHSWTDFTTRDIFWNDVVRDS